MPDPNFVEVYRAKNAPEAHLLADALEQAGIAAMIDGEMLQGAAGAIPLGWSTAPRILVAAADVPKAREILERLEQQEQA